MNIHSLETPALLLDVNKMEANIAKMRKHLSQFDVIFRPHLKSAKAIEAANACMDGPKGPITVSTLAEADFFSSHGVTDILYAVGLAPNKFAHVLRLMQQGIEMKVLLDSFEAAKLLVAFAKEQGAVFDVCIEIDVDGHRSGLKPDDPNLPKLAALLQEGGQNVLGVLTHAGESYKCTTTQGIVDMAEQERARIVQAAKALRDAGFACPMVSLGSTPTASFVQNLDGVTEVRAGVFMFQDLTMAGIGVCQPEEIAVSVLASIIGHQEEKAWAIIDAGWMALSRDRSTATQAKDQAYGLVCDIDGNIMQDIIVFGTNQEHGIIAARNGATLPSLPIGTLVRILPNHACATVAPYDRYHVLRDGVLCEVWKHCTGW